MAASARTSNEPSGKFPVDVSAAKFPTDQRLAETSDLQLTIENTGDEQIPDLAVTINTGDQVTRPGRSRSASIRPGSPTRTGRCGSSRAAIRSCASPGETGKQLDEGETAGAAAAQTNTFSFGPMAPGDTKDIVWRVTPVIAGTYTIHYELAAGLNGKAEAVTESGGPVQGEFVVTIADKPPQRPSRRRRQRRDPRRLTRRYRG